MIALWIAAALISAAAAIFIVQRAIGAGTQTSGEDPALAVYRRQLKELDELADRDLLPAAERKSARAEAARRLLGAAQASAVPLQARTSPVLIIAAAVAAPLLALAVYLVVGSPQTPDQPFRARLADWRAADPASLDPPRMAAVLQTAVSQHPGDPAPRAYLAQADLMSGDPIAAAFELRRALKLAPGRADLWAALGEALTSEDDPRTVDEAKAAFERAIAIDPKAAGPRYYLGRDAIERGDVADGLARWRALAADLPPTDPRHDVLLQQIAAVQATGALPPSRQPQTDEQPGQAGQAAFIRSMVDRLAARLAAQPNDPQGWGRLIRAYAVLGDTPARAAALAHAQSLFRDKPDQWRMVQDAAGGAA